jgi:hypothetical protein
VEGAQVNAPRHTAIKIGRFQVAVGDALVMGGGDSGGDLNGDLQHPIQRQSRLW